MSEPQVLFLDHVGVLGGAELYLLDVLQMYQETGHVVLFETGPFYGRLQDAGISVEVCEGAEAFLEVNKSASLWTAAQAIPGLARLVLQVARKARNFDVVFANSQKALIVAGLVGLLTRRPIVWNLHDMLTAEHFSTFTRKMAVVWGNRLVDWIIANSRATEQAFARSGGQTNKATVVYNGINPKPFEEGDSADVKRLRDQLGLKEVPLLGVFSRLAPWKGQHVVLRALPEIQEAHVLFVGDTLFRGDESYKQELQKTIRRLKIGDRVHFLGFRSDVPRLMMLVDVVLHTSTAPEPFGRVVVEGMLSGTPVIATRAGGPVEIVREPDTGKLVPPDDPGALATAVRDLLSNPKRAHEIGEKAQSYAKRRFSISRMQRKVDAVIRQVCGLG